MEIEIIEIGPTTKILDLRENFYLPLKKKNKPKHTIFKDSKVKLTTFEKCQN